MNTTTEQIPVESERSLEAALQMLWEKAREASVVISTLREEKKKLLYQIDELEKEIQHLYGELESKKKEIDELRSNSSLETSNGMLLNDVDKKEMQEKLKLVLGKINSYL